MKRNGILVLLLLLLVLPHLAPPAAAAAPGGYSSAQMVQLNQSFRSSGQVLKPRFTQGREGLVRAVQRMLNRLDYGPLTADGTFDRGTREAVRSFQKHHHLTQDGCVNRATWARLLGEYRRVEQIP